MEVIKAFRRNQVVHVVESWNHSSHRWEPINRIAQVMTKCTAEWPRVKYLDDGTEKQFYYPGDVRAEGF